MSKKKVLIFHYNKVVSYPPVISLIQNLLKNNHQVLLVSFDCNSLPQKILRAKNFRYINITFTNKKNVVTVINRKLFVYRKIRNIVRENMKKYDVLWTTTDYSVKILGKTVLNYKHVMQLMELEYRMPLFGKTKLLSYPINKYAQRAWKVVVPEINRAYIQKAWWDLERLPEVLPNNPYELQKEISEKYYDQNAKEYFNEKRKIIIYLGFIGADRDLSKFAEAVRLLDPQEYCLYLIGRIDEKWKNKFNLFLKEHNYVKYLGYYPAPNHQAFLAKAHIGILPYYVNNDHPYLSPLNTLYCAPNKIFEYAGFGVPMVGTDVLGLREPFEKFKIGLSAQIFDAEGIANSIKEVDSKHSEMKMNCKKYFASIDLDYLVEKILSD